LTTLSSASKIRIGIRSASCSTGPSRRVGACTPAGVAPKTLISVSYSCDGLIGLIKEAANSTPPRNSPQDASDVSSSSGSSRASR
jgi:hypothetical protein